MAKFSGQPGPGRPKGLKNKATIKRERGAKAVSAEVASVVAEKRGAGPRAARPGIMPKDLLLDAMRQAWDAAHALNEVIKDVSRDVKLLESAPVGRPLSNVKRLCELLGAEPGVILTTDAVASKLAELRDRLCALKIEAGANQGRAEELATKVAPYEHAKLQNIDGKLVGDIFVEIKKF